jgi:putative transposase
VGHDFVDNVPGAIKADDGVTRGDYYRHINKVVDYYHIGLIENVKQLAVTSRNTYGSRRMKAGLAAMSYPVSRRKAKKLMNKAGAVVKRRKTSR